MSKYVIVGCDLHDKNVVLSVACDRDESRKLVFQNTRTGRKTMTGELKGLSASAGKAEIVFAYEASSQGFGLYDELTGAGIRCYVLAPTLIPRSAVQQRRKNDDRDAQHILDVLRGHLLAGNALPAIWIPDPQTRDDRELMRTRLDVADKITALKTQVRALLKRDGTRTPSDAAKGWTNDFRSWLVRLTQRVDWLPCGARQALASLLRQLESLEKEIGILNTQVNELSETPRYKEAIRELTQYQGVGLLVAMVFLTELGDMSRFNNRRQIAAFLGLAPSCHESGEDSDRKGHITHQGPWRVRKVTCQAVWARVRTNNMEKAAFNRIARKNPKHKKIAVVACMRRLAVRLWHVALEAQQRVGAFPRIPAAA